MMREEFIREVCALCGSEECAEEFAEALTAEDYAIVEKVYTWHPAIPDVCGKRTIAALYAAGGMLVMRDMLPRAEKAQAADAKIRGIRADIAGMEKQIASIRAGVLA